VTREKSNKNNNNNTKIVALAVGIALGSAGVSGRKRLWQERRATKTTTITQKL